MAPQRMILYIHSSFFACAQAASRILGKIDFSQAAKAIHASFSASSKFHISNC
jgi:hypothetical protein